MARSGRSGGGINLFRNATTSVDKKHLNRHPFYYSKERSIVGGKAEVVPCLFERHCRSLRSADMKK
jgi:hypothetical protein